MNAILSYRNWQAKRNEVALNDVEKFYTIEAELFQKALDAENLRETEAKLMFYNSPRQQMIRSRSRCFSEINKGASLESICERLANLTKAIN